MIPKYFEFQSSAKILSGRHALENLPSELKNLGAKKPMILSDEILKKIGTLQIVTDALAAGGIREGAVYTRIPADSSLQVVRNIVKEYKKRSATAWWPWEAVPSSIRRRAYAWFFPRMWTICWISGAVKI